MKRILTIQDISCVGKCSLTVALPIISAFGVETAILPTAVLSNHTQFKSWTFRDLTDDMQGITQKWKEENIDFNCIYTGYLGSIKQIDIVSNIFDDFKTENNFTIVDPAMADNGKLYAGFNDEFVKSMAKLCGKADFIVPNMTEAAFMLGIPYVADGYDENYVKDVLKKLTGLGAKVALLTGITFDGKTLGAYGYDRGKDEFFSYMREYLPVKYHGTGDIYASTFCGALTIGKTVAEAAAIAVDFTVQSIIETINDKSAPFYGVNFERAIPYLLDKIN